MKIHHSAICTRDLERSVAFWRDGLGFVQVMDETFAGDWPTLFAAREPELRSIFLGDPADPTAGLVELVDFTGGIEDGVPSEGPPALGFFLVSVYLEIEPALERLAAAGFELAVRRITVPPGVNMAVLHDPNGVRVELIDLGGMEDPVSAG